MWLIGDRATDSRIPHGTSARLAVGAGLFAVEVPRALFLSLSGCSRV